LIGSRSSRSNQAANAMLHDDHMTTITRPLDPTTRSLLLRLLLLALRVMAICRNGGNDVRRAPE